MQTILLAAGQSSRMNPISDKNLLPFCGKPLIQHQVDALKRSGLEQIVIVVNQNNQAAITKLFENDSSIQIVEQKGEGQAAGVISGAELITEEQVLILCTNDVFEPQLFADIQEAAESDLDGVIAGKEVTEYFPGGYLSVDANNHITGIVEKPGEGNEPSNLVNLVCHFYKYFSDFLNHLKSADSQADDVYEVALDNYLKQGAKIKAHRYQGPWQALKYPWHVLDMMSHFLSIQQPHIDPSATIAETAVIKGNVVIEAGVQVFDHAVVQGPAYIGKNAIVANNALVRSSIMGEGSVAGYNTEIARSYLGNNVWTHSNYLGDSIVDSNVSFGAGAITGNLRHDEKPIKVSIKKERLSSKRKKLGAIIGSGSRMGINASTNPGVKIGQNCFIGGGVMVSRDIEDGNKIILKQDVHKENNYEQVNTQKRGKIK